MLLNYVMKLEKDAQNLRFQVQEMTKTRKQIEYQLNHHEGTMDLVPLTNAIFGLQTQLQNLDMAMKLIKESEAYKLAYNDIYVGGSARASQTKGTEE